MAKPKLIGSVNAKLWLDKHGHGRVREVKTKEGEEVIAKCMGEGVCNQCTMERLIVDLLEECEWLIGLESSVAKPLPPEEANVKPSIRKGRKYQ